MTDQLDIFAPRWKPADFDETKLTSEEQRLLAVLKVHIGRARAVRIKDLANYLTIDDRKVREILKHLSEHHIIAIGSAVSRGENGEPPGVFLIKTAEEYEEWKRQEKGRALSILKRIAIHERCTAKELYGQLAMELDA